jgi:hypothetical protein
MSDENEVASKTASEAWAKKIDQLTIKHMGIIMCLVLAGIIAATGHDGWGWFLFCALMLT